MRARDRMRERDPDPDSTAALLAIAKASISGPDVALMREHARSALRELAQTLRAAQREEKPR
jgi:hypothetical protein